MINFNALFSNLNIPKLRTTIHTAWLYILANPLTLVQSWWNKRLNGSSYTVFNPTNDYTIYNYVQYGRASYQCILTPTIGLHPLPTNTTYWYKILDDYIGINERSKYSAQKVMLEYALNRRFSPSTITPPFSSSIRSIYITTNSVTTSNILYSAPSNTNTFSWVAPNSSTTFYYNILGNPSFTTQYNFTIYIPSGIVSQIASTWAEAQYIIAQETNKYSLSGMFYNIIQY